MLYMVTFTIHIPQMLAYIPYMDPMGICMLYTYIPPQSATIQYPICSLFALTDPRRPSSLQHFPGHLPTPCLSTGTDHSVACDHLTETTGSLGTPGVWVVELGMETMK